MFTTLLCIAFSKYLNFDGLTLVTLLQWYLGHPFLFIIAMSELIHFRLNINVQQR